MANIKQKFIKPGRDYNYAEGVKVLNNTTTAIPADTIVCVQGIDGPYLKVEKADEATATKAYGRLLVTKHELPASGYGVCLPWKVVSGLSNAAVGGASGAVGTRVYLDGGSDAGKWSSSAGGAITRVVGVVLVQGTGAATTVGAILFCGEGNA